MNKTKLLAVLGVVAVIGVLALSGAGYALAQTGVQSTATPVPDGTGPDGDRPPCGGPEGGVIDRTVMETAAADALGITLEEFQTAKAEGKKLETLAEENGVDIETVRAAIEAARTEAVNQAVADGTITQEQADQILSHQPHGPGGPDGGRPPFDNVFDRSAIEAATADALGITVEEFQAAKSEGKKLETLAEENGVDIETVRAAIEAARTEAVNQAVAAGTITQEQADQILTHQPHGPGGFGGGRPHFGGPNGPGLRDSVPAATATP